MISKNVWKLFLLSIFQPVISFTQPVIIKGHVSAKKQDTIVLTSIKKIVDFIDYDKKEILVASAFPDKDGNFRFVCQSAPEGRYFDLSMGEDGVFSQVYLYPGDSVFSEIGDSVDHFYGNGASAAVFMDSCMQKYFPGSKAMKLSTDSFLAKIDSMNKAEEGYIKNYSRRWNWNKDRTKHALTDEHYFWKSEKLVYLSYHPFIEHKEGFVKVEPSYFSDISYADLHNELEINSINYITTIGYLSDALVAEKWEHLSDDTKKNLKAAKIDWGLREEMKIIDSLYTGRIKEVAIGSYLRNMFSLFKYDKENEKAARLKGIDSLLEILKIDSGKYNTGIYERFEKKRLNMSDLKNTLAPEFTLADTSGKMVNLSDFKGKVVFLDFWWVGCTPCIQAIPSSNKLQEDFTGKDFVAISICCESPDKYWKYYINKFKWKGVHLACNMATEDKYGITGFPHYMLIDKKGIIRHDNVRHENSTFDDDLKAEIKALLDEK